MIIPSTRSVGRAFQSLRWIQRGTVHRYMLYILLTLLLFFLFWK
jgi:hypothetical protein